MLSRRDRDHGNAELAEHGGPNTVCTLRARTLHLPCSHPARCVIAERPLRDPTSTVRRRVVAWSRDPVPRLRIIPLMDLIDDLFDRFERREVTRRDMVSSLAAILG